MSDESTTNPLEPITVVGRTPQEIRDLMAQYRLDNIKMDYVNIDDNSIDDILIHYMRFIDAVVQADLTSNIQLAFEKLASDGHTINVQVIHNTNNYFGIGDIIVVTIEQLQTELGVTNGKIDATKDAVDTLADPSKPIGSVLFILGNMSIQNGRIEQGVNNSNSKLDTIVAQLENGVSVGGGGSVYETAQVADYELTPENKKNIFYSALETPLNATLNLGVGAVQREYRLFEMQQPIEQGGGWSYILMYFGPNSGEIALADLVASNISFTAPDGIARNVTDLMDMGFYSSAPENNIFLMTLNPAPTGAMGLSAPPSMTTWDASLKDSPDGQPLFVDVPEVLPTLNYRLFEMLNPPEQGGQWSYILGYVDESGLELTPQELVDKQLTFTAPDGITRSITGLMDVSFYSSAPENNILLMTLDPAPTGAMGFDPPPLTQTWDASFKETTSGTLLPIPYTPQLPDNEKYVWYIEQRNMGEVTVLPGDTTIETPSGKTATTDGIGTVLRVERIAQKTVRVTGGKNLV